MEWCQVGIYWDREEDDEGVGDGEDQREEDPLALVR